MEKINFLFLSILENTKLIKNPNNVVLITIDLNLYIKDIECGIKKTKIINIINI